MSIEKVSIIIPVHNASKTISSLVDKIQKEINICKELEIVLVNDGSSLDNSSEVCESIAYNNPTVKFINLSRNVHFLNDDRAKTKLAINQQTKSKIKEIKEYTEY